MDLIITYVPEQTNIEQAILDSIEDVSQLYNATYMIDMTLLVNVEKININISKNSINNSPLEQITEYISKDNLIEKMESLLKLKDVIILNGYDINMEYIKEKIYPLMKKYPKSIISINLIEKDKKIKYPSTHVLQLTENMTAEEWEDKELELISELEEDIELQKDDNNVLANFLTNLCLDLNSNGLVIDLDKNNKKNLPITMPDKSIDKTYECVSFTNANNTITIESKEENIIITDKFGNKISLDNAAKVFLSKYLN